MRIDKSRMVKKIPATYARERGACIPARHAVLPGIPPFVTECSVGEQRREKQTVKPRQEMSKPGWQSPGGRRQQFGHIVEVAGNSPPAAYQEQILRCCPSAVV